jgi:organic hydroperoxide reductase OsmC/OhrA
MNGQRRLTWCESEPPALRSEPERLRRRIGYIRSMRSQDFKVLNRWTGNRGEGTRTYTAYSRDHEVSGAGKSAPIPGSSDPAFRGDPARYSPEELLVASLSTCHMLWMLHLCSVAGIVVTEYSDEASGEMAEHEDGSGEFTGVTLRTRMVITEAARAGDALALHERVHHLCFIARSVNFPVECEPVVTVAESVP